MWSGSQSTCHPNSPTPPTAPTPPAGPLTLPMPHTSLHCWWRECWDPGLGPNVVGLIVHLPPSNAPYCPPDAPTPCWPLPAPNTPVGGTAGTLDWGPMWSGSQSTCHPNSPTPPTAPTPPAGPLTLPMPHTSLHCWWRECWDPGLGPNVVGLIVHLPPSNAPYCPPDAPTPCWPLPAPTPLLVELLGPWTGAQCGWAHSPPATPQCPLYPLLLPYSPYIPCWPLALPVGASGGQEQYYIR